MRTPTPLHRGPPHQYTPPQKKLQLPSWRHAHVLSPLEVVPEATEDAQDNEGAERGTPEVPSGAPLDVRLDHLPERLPIERRVLAEEKHHDRRHVQCWRRRVSARRRRRRRLHLDPPSLLLLRLGRGAVVQRVQERQQEGVRVRPDYGRPQEARVGLRTYVTTAAEVVNRRGWWIKGRGRGVCVCVSAVETSGGASGLKYGVNGATAVVPGRRSLGPPPPTSSGTKEQQSPSLYRGVWRDKDS